MSIGLVDTELCCHKINMNTKEKDIIKRILNESFVILINDTVSGKIWQLMVRPLGP